MQEVSYLEDQLRTMRDENQTLVSQLGRFTELSQRKDVTSPRLADATWRQQCEGLVDQTVGFL